MYIEAGLQESHRTKNGNAWNIQKHLYFKLQSKKICLGVHSSLFVFTQNNLGFAYNVNYVCFNIKTKPKYQIQNR